MSTPEHARRRTRLRKRLIKSGMDALLVSNETNVTYLTGFTGDSSYLFVLPKSEIFISDSRYETQISEQCSELDTYIRDATMTKMDAIVAVAKKTKAGSIGVESSSITKSTFDKLNSEISGELVDTENWVEDLRAIKDKSEIATIRESIRINERAFNVIRAQLSGWQTERQIAHNLEHQIRAFGGTRCSFDPIVGVGPNGALPHATVSDARIDSSGFVLIDWGTQFKGYASDLTRVLATAKIPPKLRKIHEIVLRAQKAAIAKIRPGVTFKSVDKAARNVISKSGYGKNFGHGLGHGFGLEIHEHPFISPTAEGVFQKNMVVTVEPGIYLPGWGGVRIEDDVLVTDDGHEVLSSLPKTLEDCQVQL